MFGIQRIIKNIQLEQLMQPQQECYLCTYPSQSFSQLVAHSLFGKYSSSQNFYYTKEVNEILQEAISPAFVQFQQNNYLDQEEEYLKREYQNEEFPKKIEMLSQYYKFHRDIPTWNNLGVQRIMGKYYNRLKDVDYKRIKDVLKKEQNISLTTHKSFSSFGSDQQYTKKSRYSTMLGELNSDDQSVVLLDMCDKIGKALKKVRPDGTFKGNYYSGQKKFQEFLKKQKKRKQNIVKKQETKRQSFGLKKLKFNPKLNTKNDELGLREINFLSNHSLKGRYTGRKLQKSIQKTTANQTISREEKTKRSKSKSKINPISSSRSSISRKAYPENFISEIVKSKGVGGLNINALINNENLKTINQIYKPNEKIQPDSTRKNRQLSTKTVKFRSNSHHNLPTTKTLQKDHPLKETKNQPFKLNRSLSKKQIPISVAKGSIIDLEIAQSERTKIERQNSHRMLRSNSTSRVGTQKSGQKDKNFGNIKGSESGFTKKKNTVIENMLEKKLAVFKRKQAVY